jgi:hypothetical protein
MTRRVILKNGRTVNMKSLRWSVRRNNGGFGMQLRSPVFKANADGSFSAPAYSRSMIVPIPWPKPMHMVWRP